MQNFSLLSSGFDEARDYNAFMCCINQIQLPDKSIHVRGGKIKSPYLHLHKYKPLSPEKLPVAASGSRLLVLPVRRQGREALN